MNSMKWFALALTSLGLTIAVSCETLGLRPADYHPRIDPSKFRAVVDNPFYPLVPGTTLKYVEEDRGEVKENEITTLKETKVVMGVTCVVVHDVVTRKGVVAEDTYDWVAQDEDGTVWYFGEDTKEISPGGLVSTLGSWEAGVDGAQPGILMPAHPKAGEPYRQEYLLGVAEDMGQVVAIDESVTVPAGTFRDCVKTKDWSLLESGDEHKWYAKGVGLVDEVGSDGAVVKLISITRE
ncbi:MAG: hypothetical protein K8S98_11390 [Planctomycetes bacterium]|nr:hypothetical protein [Planctomycetota bacterium]